MSARPVVLLSAIALLGARPAADPPPRIVVKIAEPTRTIPKLERTLRFGALVFEELGPAALRQGFSAIGTDPFDLASLRALGVDLDRAIHVHGTEPGDPLVVELPLRDAAVTDRALLAAMEKTSGALRIEGGSAGFFARSIAAWRKDRALYVQLGGATREAGDKDPLGLLLGLARGRDAPEAQPEAQKAPLALSDARLRPIRVASSAKKPRTPVALGKGRGPADLSISALGGAKLERVDAAVWLTDAGFDVVASVHPGFLEELALSDFARGSRSRPLLDSAGKLAAVVDVTASLGGSGLGEVDRWLTGGLSSVLAGDVEAVLTEAGDVVLAAGLRKEVPKEAIDIALRRLEEANRGLHVSVAKRRDEAFVLAWLGALDPKTVEAALSPASELRAPLDARAMPWKIFDAVSRRSDAGDRFGLRPTQLLLFRLTAKPILDAAERVSMAVEILPGRAEVRLGVVYR